MFIYYLNETTKWNKEVSIDGEVVRDRLGALTCMSGK